MEIRLNHFEAAVVFALFTSVVFAITTKNTNRDRLRYGLWCFLAFVAVVFGAGWVMALAH